MCLCVHVCRATHNVRQVPGGDVLNANEMKADFCILAVTGTTGRAMACPISLLWDKIILSQLTYLLTFGKKDRSLAHGVERLVRSLAR